MFSNAQLAANAIRDCLRRNESELADVSMLASGSSGGDALMPGFANMIQGEMAAHPMETLSVHGICAAGVSAIQAAAQGVEWAARQRPGGGQRAALAPARSRFAARDYDADFDAHFLRWMLSDGAGALLLGNSGRALPGISRGVRLRLGCTSARSRATIRSACSWACRPTASAGTWTTRPGPTPRPTARCRCARISGCCRTCSTSASTNTPSWCAMAGWIRTR